MKVIITGTTGMVGKGILIECLEDDSITEVLSVSRSSNGVEHPKHKEIFHKDFTDMTPLQNELKGYDACFFSMGVSSVGMNEEKYTRLTFDVISSWVDVLYDNNPQMIFHYVSGQGTDSSEKGRVMWARVKGKAENYVLNKGFKDAYAFRPGAIIPRKGTKSKTGWVNAIITITKPLMSIMQRFDSVTDTVNIGKAMISLAHKGQDRKHINNKDINAIAKAYK